MKNNLHFKTSFVLGFFALMLSLNLRSQCAATFTMGPSAPLTWTVAPTYAPGTGYATWIWGDGNWTLGLYPSHTYTASGVYTICVVTNDAAMTCTSTTCDSSFIYKVDQTQAPIQISVIASPTGLNELVKDKTFSFSPNPTSGKITLQGHKTSGIVNVYNMLGMKVQEIKIESKGPAELDLSALENGIYNIEFGNGKGIIREKVILNK